MRSALVIVALLCACSSLRPGADDVTLAVEPATVSPGDSIVLVLTNGTSAAVGYNLCTTGMERQSGSGWETVPSDRVCTMELRTLEAGQQARYPSQLPAPLPPGDYRFFTSVELLDERVRRDIRSGSIRVTS